MRQVFADTASWIALTNPFDQHHEAALNASASLHNVRILTTDAVLTEFLNALAEKGAALRRAAIRTAEAILNNPMVKVLPQSRRSFEKGFALYKARPDKGYPGLALLGLTPTPASGSRSRVSCLPGAPLSVFFTDEGSSPRDEPPGPAAEA